MITHKLKDNTIITGFKNDLITNNIRLTSNYYEPIMLDFIKANIQKGVMIDVGANIGNHTIFLAKYCATKVIAFEPFPETYSILEKNILQNNLKNVHTYNLGLGNSNEELLMSAVEGNMGMNKIDAKGNTPVKIVALDSTKLISEAVTLIKIDCEGYEEKALIGMYDLLTKDKPALFIECQTEKELTTIQKLLAPLDYNTAGMFNRTPTYYFKA